MTSPLSDTRLAEIRERVNLSSLQGPETDAGMLSELLAEVDRLRMFGEKEHAERGVKVDRYEAALREIASFCHCTFDEECPSNVARRALAAPTS